MRLEAGALPDTLDCHMSDLESGRERPCRPVGRGLRRRLLGERENLRLQLGGDAIAPPTPWRIGQPLEPLLLKAFAPPCQCRRTHLQPRSEDRIRLTIRDRQNHPRALHEASRQSPRVRHALELRSLVRRERQLIGGSEHAQNYYFPPINATLVTVH